MGFDFGGTGNKNIFFTLYVLTFIHKASTVLIMTAKLDAIERFAREKMQEHSLDKKGWIFVWDNRARRRFGQCRFRGKEIGVTRALASINAFDKSKDVVLHEIAHALTGPGHGHDAQWKRMCVKVGARPERCYKSEYNGGTVKTLPGKYKVIHAHTGEVFCVYHRKPKMDDWPSRWIKGRKQETYGKLKVVPV